LGAIAAKFVYAVWLACLVRVIIIIADLEGIGWFAKWWLILLVVWGVFFEREDIVGWVLPQRAGALQTAYYGYQMARDIGGGAVRNVTWAPRKVAAKGGGVAYHKASDEIGRRRDSRDEALKGDAQRTLEERAQKGVFARKEGQLTRARGILAQEETLGHVNERLGGVQRELATATAERDKSQGRLDAMPSHKKGGSPSKRKQAAEALSAAKANVTRLTTRRDSLAAQQARLQSALGGEEIGWARGVVRSSVDGLDVSDSEINEWISQRRREMDTVKGDWDQSDAARTDRELLGRVVGVGMSPQKRKRAQRELEQDWDRARLVGRQASQIHGSKKREERRRSGMGRR
jgi:hypothetical protein